MAFDGPLLFFIKPWSGRFEIFVARFDTFLATDAYPFVNDAGIGASLPVYL
jgi:hypothetical protein